MKFTLIASLMIFSNIAFATQLRLACSPKGMEAENGKLPMVLHIALGNEVTSKLDANDLNLLASESGTTMAMEINFTTPIGGPGISDNIPAPVLKKDQNI